jgi:hypothetical protein
MVAFVVVFVRRRVVIVVVILDFLFALLLLTLHLARVAHRSVSCKKAKGSHEPSSVRALLLQYALPTTNANRLPFVCPHSNQKEKGAKRRWLKTGSESPVLCRMGSSVL